MEPTKVARPIAKAACASPAGWADDRQGLDFRCHLLGVPIFLQVKLRPSSCSSRVSSLGITQNNQLLTNILTNGRTFGLNLTCLPSILTSFAFSQTASVLEMISAWTLNNQSCTEITGPLLRVRGGRISGPLFLNRCKGCWESQPPLI